MQSLPEPFTSVLAAAVGLVLGSFLNVCIHRLPLGESVVRPGSRCPGCRAPIGPLQNIPLFSWLFLRGRCAACGASISIRYPAVELLSGLLVLGLWWGFGLGAAFPIAAFFGLAMIVLFFTDYDHQLLPDVVTLGGLGVGLAVAWFNPFLDGEGWRRVWLALSGAAVGSGLLWGFGALYGRLRGVEAMGMGDVKMMAMVGAFAGPFAVLMTIFGGSVVGAIVGVALIPLRGKSLQDTLPFGCFLAPAAFFALLASGRVWVFYMRWVLPPI